MSYQTTVFDPGILPPLASQDEWLVDCPAFAKFERRMERRLATLEKRWISLAAPRAARASLRIEKDYGVRRRDLNKD